MECGSRVTETLRAAPAVGHHPCPVQSACCTRAFMLLAAYSLHSTPASLSARQQHHHTTPHTSHHTCNTSHSQTRRLSCVCFFTSSLLCPPSIGLHSMRVSSSLLVLCASVLLYWLVLPLYSTAEGSVAHMRSSERVTVAAMHRWRHQQLERRRHTGRQHTAATVSSDTWLPLHPPAASSTVNADGATEVVGTTPPRR